MKRILFILAAACCSAAAAQTNGPAAKPPPPAPTEITSDSADFDLNSRQAVYRGHVFVSDPEVKLHCELLTINFPPEDGRTNQIRRPNHVQAETNVVIDFTDEKGEKYHVTSDKTIYSYSVVNSVTNETVLFTGLPDRKPQVETADAIITSEPMVWNRVTRHFEFTNPHMISRQNLNGGGGTNASPLKSLLK